MMAEDEDPDGCRLAHVVRHLRGSIAMFDLLLAECGDSSKTARVVEAARRRRETVLKKIERRLQR
jgi:hypothetical protein